MKHHYHHQGQWADAPSDLIDAIRALRERPHGTQLVADDGRVLAVAQQGMRRVRPVYSVDLPQGRRAS